jgi:amino acid adenylation domain-containing protein
VKHETFPASSGQQRLWFLHEYEAESAEYNVPLALRLSGMVDEQALGMALDELVRRHACLRTRFVFGEEGLRQIVDVPTSVPVQWVDFTSLPAHEAEACGEDVLREEARRPFDLREGALRVVGVRIADAELVVLLLMHHIVTDGWSLEVLKRELGLLYSGLVKGEPAELPALPIDYVDYTVWQNSLLEVERLEEAIAYWREQLAGLTGLDLPSDRPRPPHRSGRGSVIRFRVGAALVETLTAIARRSRATLFMVLAAAFELLLSRYSGEDEIAIGTPVANRDRAELEGLIGFFVNTLVLRTDLSGVPDFPTLLKRVRETALAAFAHQQVPFEQLVEALQPERDPSRTPLVQVMLEFSHGTGNPGLAGLTVIELPVDTGTAKFDLSVGFRQRDGELEGRIEYSTDLFDTATVERLAGHFQTLLGSIARRPDAPLHELEMLGEQERRTLLRDWNATAVEYPQRCLHQLFEEQAAARPEAVALVHEGEELSYGDLNRRANRLAHHLRDHGAGPERLVAIFLDRSIDMIVALLATLKTGAAYVPIDPDYPTARIEYMLVDSRAQLLLTASRLSARVPVTSATVISLDHDADAIARRPSTNLGTTADPDNLAYVIYTSGSTGQPKGVCLTHRNATAFVAWAIRAFTRDALRRVLVATSSSFDLFVFELFAPLAAGTTAVLVEDILSLADLPDADEITLLNTVPSACQELVAAGALPQSVEVVNLAGEALRRQLVETIYQSGYSGQVRNLYGPTECTTYATQSLVDRGRSEPTIGRPVGNVHVYVLDHSLRPLPIGVTGEIFIGGTCVARGYLNRPALTAECFVPDPFSTNGARLYRTGDLARYLPSGELEFLGRRDDQVKIRGYRIELGEIEAVLLSQSGVREAVAVLVQKAASFTLVAFVVAERQGYASVVALRESLASRLPRFMVPTRIMHVDELPKTPNGKIDRRALEQHELPHLPPSRADDVHLGDAPVQSVVEQTFATVLGLDSVDPDADFFALGGDSLAAVRVMARLREMFDPELPLRTVFDSPTARELSRRLTSDPGDSFAASMAPESFG